MDHFFTRNSMGRVFGFLEVNSVRKKLKIFPNFKIPEIFGFLDLGLSLEPDTWLYLFDHGISQTQPMWGHIQNFISFGPLILHLPGGAQCAPPLSQMWSWDPLSIRVNLCVFISHNFHVGAGSRNGPETTCRAQTTQHHVQHTLLVNCTGNTGYTSQPTISNSIF